MNWFCYWCVRCGHQLTEQGEDERDDEDTTCPECGNHHALILMEVNFTPPV